MKKPRMCCAVLAASFFLPMALPAEESPSPAAVLENFAEEIRKERLQLIDLSHPLEDGIPVFPGGVGFELISIHTFKDDGFVSNRISMGEHTGTHVDAPLHLERNGDAIHQMKLKQFIGWASVIDVRENARKNPDYELSLDDIVKWEEAHGTIRPGSMVLLLTGWSDFWGDPQRYISMGRDRLPHFPGYSVTAAEFLLKERAVLGVGTDALSVDAGHNGELPAHKILHAGGKFHLENLTHLEKLPPQGAYVLMFPIPIKHGSGAPARVVALVPQKEKGLFS